MGKEEDIRQRMILVATRLLEQTLAGRITWIQTDSEDEYLYAATEGSVVVDLDERSYNTGAYGIALKNARGTTVEELRTYHPSDEPAPAYNDVLERLFDAARREALGIDKLLDGLLTDIEKGVTGKPPASSKGGFAPDDPWATAAPTRTKAFDDEPPF